MQLAREATARPLGQIAAQRAFRLAVLAGVVSYAVMSFIMTATPISMHSIDGHSGSDTSLVISGHLLGMYLPSLATGWLINALGIQRLMIAGTVAMLASLAISVVLGHGFLHYFAGLMLLGIGWNFLFVGGTTLLTTTYAPAERFRAQGFNDLAVFGSQTVASLLAGAAIQTLGWQRLNLVTLPLIALMMFAVFALRRV
jgi:MFS family permease